MDPLTLLPADTLGRARALLEARNVRRPPETLAFLAQELLRWHCTLKGVPSFEPASLKSLARAFREMGFDCLPGKLPRWSADHRTRTEELFRELAILVAEGPPLELPALRRDREPEERPWLVRCLWNHLDYHVSALTVGLIGSGVLASDPEDPRFEAQGELRGRVVQIVGTLVPFAIYLGGNFGGDMPLDQAELAISALLDGLASSLEQAFDLGGTRGRWMARCGGWERPEYPCRMGNFEAALLALPKAVPPGDSG